MTKESWEEYCEKEIKVVVPILLRYGITLTDTQPHIKGERFLMQAVTTTSGKKVILLGTTAEGMQVVIKASRDAHGREELRHERACREILKEIDFAAEVFLSPKEILFIQNSGMTIAVQEFITQEQSFLERTTEAQFDFALRAFKAQEGTHATTWKHRQLIQNVFDIRTGEIYLENFGIFVTNLHMTIPEAVAVHTNLATARHQLAEGLQTIDQYADFLTHTDFVPHNIRIHDNTIYLLDHSSLTFGNKYEGWARFINFMTLYNPPLAGALTEYVHVNRTPEESIALRMMRIYRLTELIWFYVRTLPHTEGNLRTLNEARVTFWNDVLTHVLNETPVPAECIETYKNLRDSLRSEDEKKRQQGLH